MHSVSVSNHKPPAGPSPDLTRVRKTATWVLAALLLLGLGWFLGGLGGCSGGSVRWQSETPEAARVATEFLTHYLTFSAARVQQPELLDLMTPEFQQAYQLIWQDPKLLSAFKKHAAQVSVSADLPVFKAKDAQGNYYFEVTGRVTATSGTTAIRSIERAFAGTLLLVKTERGFKVANAVWKNQR